MATYRSADPIRVHYEYSNDITLATVTLPVEIDGKRDRLTLKGFTRKHPDDEYDRGVGETKSLARALTALAEILEDW